MIADKFAAIDVLPRRVRDRSGAEVGLSRAAREMAAADARRIAGEAKWRQAAPAERYALGALTSGLDAARSLPRSTGAGDLMGEGSRPAAVDRRLAVAPPALGVPERAGTPSPAPFGAGPLRRPFAESAGRLPDLRESKAGSAARQEAARPVPLSLSSAVRERFPSLPVPVADQGGSTQQQAGGLERAGVGQAARMPQAAARGNGQRAEREPSVSHGLSDSGSRANPGALADAASTARAAVDDLNQAAGDAISGIRQLIDEHKRNWSALRDEVRRSAARIQYGNDLG